MNTYSFNYKAILKGIGYLVLYLILPSILSIPFNIIKKQNNITFNLENIIIHLLITIIFILISYKTIKKDIKTFNKQMIKKALIYWLIGLSIMIISSTIISLFDIPLPINEVTNRNNLKLYPITELIISSLFIPIIEEIIFRLSYKDLSNNKHIFAIYTGLFFALMHLPDAFTTPIMLMHIIPYAAVAIAFGYTYITTKNIIPTMITHSLHNFLSILKSFIIGG